MTHTKENEMQRGHVTGHKRERCGKAWWYQTAEAEAMIQQLEAEWQHRETADALPRLDNEQGARITE
jgi:hypothetical protein